MLNKSIDRLETDKEVTKLLNTFPEAVVSANIKKEVIFWNKSAEKMFGWKKKEVIGRKLDFIMPDMIQKDRSHAFKKFSKRKKLREKVKKGYRTLGKRKNGEEFPVELTLSMHHNKKGQIHVVGIIRDITKITKTQKALQESELKYSTIVENSVDGVIIIQNGTIKFSNQSFRKIAGYSHDELIRMHFLNVVAPESKKIVSERYKKRLSGAKLPEIYDIKILHKDRTTKDVSISVRIIEYQGKPATMAIIHDITEKKKAEGILEENEARYRRLFESAQDGIVITDAETGKIYDVNPYLLKMLGYSEKEILGKEIWQISPFKDITSNKAKFKELKRKKYVRYEGLPLQTKKGKKFYVEFVSNVYKVGNKNVIQANIRDITERKISEEKLTRSELRFKQVAEAAKEWIWETDVKGLYTYSSPVVKQILGYTPEEIVEKKHFYDLFEPSIREAYKKSAFKLFKQKLSINGFVNENVHKNGNKIMLSTNGAPILDSNGKLTGYRGADTDITLRVEAETEMIKSKLATESIIQAVPLIIATASPNLKFQYWNPTAESMLGYTKSESSKISLKDLYANKAEYGTTHDLLEKDGYFKGELLLKHKGGSIFPSTAYIHKLFDEKGKLFQYLIVAEDISEIKKIQDLQRREIDELKRIDELKTEFLSITSHELKTPLTPIRMYLDLLFDRSLGPLNGEQESSLETIKRNFIRLERLIDGILDLVRLESKRMKFVFEKSDIKKVLKEAIIDAETSAKDKKIKLKTKIKGKIPKISVDPMRISQIFTNLIENAIKFSPKNTTITITIKKDKDKIIASVKDKGIGVPKDQQRKLFQKFYQVDSSETRAAGGLGLGLVISKGIVEAHQGKIWIQSKPRKGTTMNFSIPIRRKEDGKDISS